MSNKRFLLVLLLSTLFLVLFPGFVSAGCCLTPREGLGCSNVSDSSLCSASDQEWRPNDECYALEECALGCCCPTGVGGSNYSCQSPKTFIKGPFSPGVTCSCGVTYSVRGIITDTSNHALSGAIVSASGTSSVSLADGSYYLDRVSAGTQVLVGARKDGCISGTTTIANLNSNRDNINIALNCVCSEGECNAALNASCTSTNYWRVYTLPEESVAYCSRCRAYDLADCQQLNLCVGGDGACPLSCSNARGASNFDSDCICSMTPNGACPPSSFGCNSNNDADCIILTHVCGNGIIEYPYETCEPNLSPWGGQMNLCSNADCSDCNCRGLSRCGNLILDSGELCEIGMVCANGSMCENCQCAASFCSGVNLNPKIDASYDYANQRMLVNWSLLDSCKPSVRYYSVYRCEGCNPPYNLAMFSPLPTSSNPLSLTLSSQTLSYSDTLIWGNSKYCYYVKALYADSRPDGVSPVICESTGDAFCINPHTREFCLNNDRYTCNANNNLQRIQDCYPGYCMPPDYSGITRCVNQSVCDYCNGLYGVFANLPGLKVTVQGTSDYSYRWCNPTGSEPKVEGCYYDRTRTLFSAYKYCSNVSTCYDYKSQTACLDPDSCDGKTGPCVWNWTQNTKPELGGVCRPLNENNQQCELCDSKNYNWLSPSCTPEICKLFGNCYYLGPGSWRGINSSCSSEKLITCGDYNTSNKCMGGTPVSIDATYTANVRTAGTHQITMSHDTLNLGKCYWYDFGNGYGVCLRDADGLRIVNYGSQSSVGWDCDSNDTVCNSDFESPTTTILPRSGCNAGGIYGERVGISYVASDDRYYSNELKTYFCITRQGTSCYPTNTGFNGTYSEPMTSSGFYNVYYYSQDPAKNLEVVNNITIEVDASPPSILFTNPAATCSIQPTQTSLPIEGIVSNDTLVLCAKNKRTNREVCINNCLVNNNVQPCISSSGSFALNIPITAGTGLTNITLYAEDRACNYFENTIQATCSGNVFPGLKINISYYYI